MAVVTAHGHEHPDVIRARHVRINRAGLWLFFFSEAVLFSLVGSARFFLEGIEAEHLDQNLGLIITVILLLSSVTAWTAETSIDKGRHSLGTWMLVATIALGVVFAGGVAYEWETAHFTRHEAFGTAFFTMTGLHAAHVVSGVGLLGLVLIQHLRGRFGPGNSWPVQGVVMYWHFVDVVWVFFYPALYLVQGV